MVIETRSLLLVAAAGFILAPAVPPEVYVVRNNTALTLACSYRENSGTWSAFLELEPDSQMPLPYRRTGSVRVACKPPVVQRQYPIAPGERYTFLREGNGPVELRRIATGDR